MAASATEWAWRQSRAKNGSLIVLLAIADEIDNGREAVMSVAQLAAKAHLSERAVQAAASDLGRLGLTSAIRVKGGSAYQLAMVDHASEGADSAPLPAGKGADSAPPQILHPADSAPPDEMKPQVKPKGAESAPPEISDMYVVTNGRSMAEVKDVPAKPPRRREDRPDVERLCAHLAERITANGSRPPAITAKWRDAARLLVDRDGITEEQAHLAIDWCQDHEFWRANILSMPKLREKYDQLRQQARRQPKRNDGDRKLGIIAGFIERAGNE